MLLTVKFESAGWNLFMALNSTPNSIGVNSIILLGEPMGDA